MRVIVLLLLCVSLIAGRDQAGIGQTLAPASANAACGNGLLDAGETCEQCAADCAVQACKAPKAGPVFTIDFTPPPAPDVTVVMLRVGYRSDRLSIPGKGTEKSVQTRVKSAEHAEAAVNDLDYALRIGIVRQKAISAGQLATISFDQCGGAPPPTAADLSCEVLDCSGSTGGAAGCSCTISLVR